MERILNVNDLTNEMRDLDESDLGTMLKINQNLNENEQEPETFASFDNQIQESPYDN